jgi:hypothetical protein
MDLIDSRKDSLDGGSALHKAATYKGQHKHGKNSYRHASSGIRTHDPRVREAEDVKLFVVCNHFALHDT